MGKVTGFMEIERAEENYQPVDKRVIHWREFTSVLSDKNAALQGARCMDCGIPFCHHGCPLNNLIPDWNDLVYQSQWQEASEQLHRTNNFPEITGRICPAPCEAACTLNINSDAVAIKAIEHKIADHALPEHGWLPQKATHSSGRSVAVIGSGPAGLAAAQQLARLGHTVAVFEKADRAGGLLRYGIPDFKLEKVHIDRRISQMEAEGVVFHLGHLIDENTIQQLRQQHDAVIVAIGSEQPRDLPIPGREAAEVMFALDFLIPQNQANAGTNRADRVVVKDKHVVVIGGGDTGSDCVGTSKRQGAASITQFELMPQPPISENKPLTWPYWPLKWRESSSHQEGCERQFAISTERFVLTQGHLSALEVVDLDWSEGRMSRRIGSERLLKADYVFLAMGYVHPVHQGLIQALGVGLDPRGNVAATELDFQTTADGVFACGDARRGQSLVVWAIREGRRCAEAVHRRLSQPVAA